MANELTKEEMSNLSISGLVEKMDQVRLCSHEERHSGFPPEFMQPIPTPYLIRPFMEIKLISSKNKPSQRKLAYCAFRYLLQLDLLLVECGRSSLVSRFYGKDYWNSPTYSMQSAVSQQYQIIASRIALECFFHLIYAIDTGELMDSKKGKFKKFKDWMKKKDNPYTYFVGHMVKAWEFDRKYRTPEVHGTSRFADSILRLQKPGGDELNVQFGLTNIIINLWPRLIEILNGESPKQISGVDEKFATQYFKKSENETAFFNFICEILDPI